MEHSYKNGIYLNLNEDGSITVFKTDGKAKDTVYSDRMLQWNYKKFNDLKQKHFGNQSQYWNGRDVDKNEAFLSDYIGKKIKLVEVRQYTHKTSGYPYWRFDIDFNE